jgi:hypothetical protein
MRMGYSETGQAAGSAEKAVEQGNARMILLIDLMRAFLPNVRGVARDHPDDLPEFSVTLFAAGGVTVKNASVFSPTFGFGVFELNPQCGNSAN